MIHHFRCPLCKNDEIIPLLRCTDHLVSRNEYRLFRCTDCSFVFTQDYPEESEIGKYYESDEYISHTDSDKTLFEKLYQLVRKIMFSWKRKLIINTCQLSKGTLLDIGSGTGHFIAAMEEAGWSVKGIEINEKARESSVSRFDLEVLSQEQLSSLQTSSFDCITLWHVMEHLHEPNKYASEIVRLLKPGGTCIIALPNCNSFDAKYYREYWAAYDVPRHLWHFTPKAFGLFAEIAGLKIKIIRRLPPDVFYISVLSEKNKGSRFSFCLGILKGIVFSVRSLFSITGSSSLIYCLRKETD